MTFPKLPRRNQGQLQSGSLDRTLDDPASRDRNGTTVVIAHLLNTKAKERLMGNVKEDEQPNSAVMAHAVNDLLRTMKTTRGCRFNAAKRLEARERSLTRLTSFSSVYVVSMTVIPYFLIIDHDTNKILNLLTFVFGLIILVSSLLQNSNRDAVSAEQHHRCALEISEIVRDLSVESRDMNESKTLAYNEKYNRVLQKYSINHDEVDFSELKLNRPEEFSWITRSQWVLIRAHLIVVKQWINCVLLIITLLLAWVLLAIGFLPDSLLAGVTLNGLG